MNKKKGLIILTLTGILAIITGVVLMFISSVQKDQKEMNDRMKKINTIYNQFKTDMEEINTERDNIHKEFLDTIYYDTFLQNETNYRKKIYYYEKNVTSLSKQYTKLKEYCKLGIYYSSSDTNSKCNAFQIGYEQLINTLVDDINKYNNNIQLYNKWAKDNNIESQLELYETKKTYIDFNKDGNYSGKEDNDNEE